MVLLPLEGVLLWKSLQTILTENLSDYSIFSIIFLCNFMYFGTSAIWSVSPNKVVGTMEVTLRKAHIFG